MLDLRQLTASFARDLSKLMSRSTPAFNLTNSSMKWRLNCCISIFCFCKHNMQILSNSLNQVKVFKILWNPSDLTADKLTDITISTFTQFLPVPEMPEDFPLCWTRNWCWLRVLLILSSAIQISDYITFLYLQIF